MRVTLSLREETVARVRVEAAKEGKSLSRWLAEQVARWKAEDEPHPAIERRRRAAASSSAGAGRRKSKSEAKKKQ